MQTIIVSETEKGYSISLPFELKNNFRANFKSATWNVAKKTWDIGFYAKDRLEQWVSTAQAHLPTDADIQDYDQRKMLQAEIDELSHEADRLMLDYRAEDRIFADAETLMALVEKTKNKVIITKATLEAKKTKADDITLLVKQEIESAIAILTELADEVNCDADSTPSPSS